MSLKFGKAKFGVAKPQEGKLAMVEISQEVTQVDLKPPCILPEAELGSYIGSFPPTRASFRNGCWYSVPNDIPTIKASANNLLGDNFKENDGNIYLVKKGQE